MERKYTFSTTSQGVWTLEKTDIIEPLVRYTIQPLPNGEPYPAQLLFDVTDKLLSGKCVGIMAESESQKNLSGLCKIWHDGRLLRRSEGCSFVCIEPCFLAPIPALKSLYLSGVADFHFSLFSNTTPEETMFRHMLNTHTDAPLRLLVPKSADKMVLVVNTNQFKESEFLSKLSEAVSFSGRSIKYSA